MFVWIKVVEWFRKFFGKEVSKKKAVLEVYRDKGRQWRWRLVATNGNIIANSGEGYKNKCDCTNMVEGIVRGMDIVERKIPK